MESKGLTGDEHKNWCTNKKKMGLKWFSVAQKGSVWLTGVEKGILGMTLKIVSPDSKKKRVWVVSKRS